MNSQMNWLIEWDLGASILMELECVTFPVWMCSRTWRLLETCTTGIFMEASSHRHDRSLTPFIPLSLLWRIGDGAENSKLLIMACSFQWPAPIQKPSRSSPRITSLEIKDAPSVLITSEFTRILGALCQGQRQRSSIRTRDAPHDVIT